MEWKSERVYWDSFHYKEWCLFLAATDDGLCCLTMPNESFAALEQWVKKYIRNARLQHAPQKLAPYEHELKEYFSGQSKQFYGSLDLRGTPFQIQVWHALLKIPYGQVHSYSDIAARIEQPKAIRAVGAANRANPLPIVIPCHRVIGKNGALTGYRGGLDMKIKLLRLEGFDAAMKSLI